MGENDRFWERHGSASQQRDAEPNLAAKPGALHYSATKTHKKLFLRMKKKQRRSLTVIISADTDYYYHVHIGKYYSFCQWNAWKFPSNQSEKQEPEEFDIFPDKWQNVCWSMFSHHTALSCRVISEMLHNQYVLPTVCQTSEKVIKILTSYWLTNVCSSSTRGSILVKLHQLTDCMCSTTMHHFTRLQLFIAPVAGGKQQPQYLQENIQEII